MGVTYRRDSKTGKWTATSNSSGSSQVQKNDPSIYTEGSFARSLAEEKQAITITKEGGDSKTYRVGGSGKGTLILEETGTAPEGEEIRPKPRIDLKPELAERQRIAIAQEQERLNRLKRQNIVAHASELQREGFLMSVNRATGESNIKDIRPREITDEKVLAEEQQRYKTQENIAESLNTKLFGISDFEKKTFF